MHSKERSQLADCFSVLHHVITQHSNECPLPAGNTLRHFTVRVKKIMVLIIKKFINSQISQVPDGLRLSFSNLLFLVPSALMLVRPVNRLSPLPGLWGPQVCISPTPVPFPPLLLHLTTSLGLCIDCFSALFFIISLSFFIISSSPFLVLSQHSCVAQEVNHLLWLGRFQLSWPVTLASPGLPWAECLLGLLGHFFFFSISIRWNLMFTRWRSIAKEVGIESEDEI